MKVNNIKLFIKWFINWKGAFFPWTNCLRIVGLWGPVFTTKIELCQQIYFIQFYIIFATKISVYKLLGLISLQN